LRWNTCESEGTKNEFKQKDRYICGSILSTWVCFVGFGDEILTGPILNASDYLINVDPNKARVIIAVLI
jgi:hypothetical protein